MEKNHGSGLLKKMRQRAKKTQKAIAGELKVSHQAISIWEADEKKCPPARMGEIAQAYGMTCDERNTFFEALHNPPPMSEYEVFYGLITLPKEIREKIIKAVRIYEAS